MGIIILHWNLPTANRTTWRSPRNGSGAVWSRRTDRPPGRSRSGLAGEPAACFRVMRRLLLMAICLGAFQLRAETVWLSALDLKQMTSGWSVPQADRGITGKPISIGGKNFARGVGIHAASKMRLDLGGKAKRFFAQAGLDDSAGGQGSVEFIVSGDGKVLWRSGLLTGGKAALP